MAMMAWDTLSVSDALATELCSLNAEPTNVKTVQMLIWKVFDAARAGDLDASEAAFRDARLALAMARLEVGRGPTFPAVVREPRSADPEVACLRRPEAP
jgi:hypothetical protein